MPKTWQRTTTRGAFSETDLQTAIERVRMKEISIREASRTYKIGRQTLDRYLQATPEGEQAKKVSKTFSNTIFSQDEEKNLFAYAEKSAAMHFGLTSKVLAELAYDYAKKLGRKLPSSWEDNKAAGDEWCLAFRRRNGLSLRTPENTSIARSQAFSPTNVQRFHEALSAALLKHDFGPCTVWNLDETGITTVTKAPKLLSPTGTRQVGVVASAERGVLITVCACASAAGRALPPVLLYPRKRAQPHWATDAPPGSLILANDSGWMDKETFPKALTHFISHMGASEQNPQLLVFDNHCSHITLQVINIARENGVVIVTLPAHCSHRMQPLDVSVCQ